MRKGFYIALLAMAASVGNVFSQSKTITGGNDHGLIICAQGYLYTWGNNYSKVIGGPLLGIDPDDPKTGGNATKDFVTEPSRVNSGNLTFSQVTAGSGAFNLALACNSVVYAWGENSQGGCGQGPAGENVIKYPVPVLKGETSGYSEDGTPGGDYLGGVTYIAASTNSGFAIMDDGRVVGWGKGAWNGSTNKTSPVYIKDKSGKDITNVTHISGGDDNCLIRTADGKLYGIGPWNGSSEDAVTYATPVLKEEDLSPLTDIRMSAAGDVCGFAVTGDGYVWSWGNGGWGGSTGVSQTGATHYQARKVSSGEYKTISGEEYLTDIKEVIGGRGHGAAVTKEGYLVYWGCNDGNGGVAPVDATTSKTYKSGQGVKPVLARYCDASGKPGEVVKNAVSVSRGDNFDFMMNDEDKYYVWGLNDLGQCGVGTTVSKYACLVELETIPCDIQDNCPEVFMTDQVKCPGEEIELDCGFVVPKGKEERYFIQWSYNGKVLNSATKDDPKDARKADKFNVQSINITDPGTYSVVVEYIGNNIPCDKCKPAEVEITVEDMEMPIDTVLTTMQCVAEPLKPGKADNICFEAVVNDKFYNAKQKVTFAAFSTVDSKDTLDVFETTGAGGEIKFCVSGDKIKEIHDNKDEDSKDTIYNVYLEDISKFETLLRKGKPGAAATGGSFQSYGMLLDMRASADLISFDIYAKSYSGSSSVSVTPVIYMAEKNENDLYVVGEQYWQGKAQTFTIDDSAPNQCTVKCDVRIPGSTTRGIRYILGMKFTGNCTLYDESVTVKQNSAEFATPVIDSEKFGIYEMGATANSYTTSSNGSNKTCYYNVTFGKLTDYDCGRILLSAQYGCPPCNRPDAVAGKYVTITASEDIKTDIDPKYNVVELCKESPELSLNIEKLTSSNADAAFDILWFDQNESFAEDDALAGPELKATTFELTTDWATVAGKDDIEEDVEKIYYVMVRDNEKPMSADCYVFDSIKVIAHPVPTDTIEWIEFCEGDLLADIVFGIENKTIKWADKEPTDIADLKGPESTGRKEYTYNYTVVDDKTGCESIEHTLTITVGKTAKPDVETTIPQLKHPTNKFKLSAAVNSVDDNCEIRWYESETATSELESTDISLAEAKTIEVWAEQYNTETGCVSERVMVEIIINDAPVPEVTNESLCIEDEIPDLSEYVKAKDANHTLNWYEDASAEKGTGKAEAPSFKAEKAGTYKFYVSQTNTETNAESEKATLTITVHETATLDLSKNQDAYCINDDAKELTFTANEDGEFTKATWSKKSDMTDATESITPKTDEKGAVTYYARAEYENKDAVKTYASAVCYGKIADIEITTSKTEVPESKTNYTVQYLAAEGEANGGSFKTLLDQDNTSVIVETGCTLNWYDENKKPISEPAPEYIAGETGERKITYYVSQTNTATGCESVLTEVTAIISSFPAPEVTSITLCQGSEKLKSSYPLTAKISTKGGFPESDYELVWYKEDPKANPSATEYSSIDLSTEDLAYDSETETEKDFKYYVVQRYLGAGGGQSPASELLVTLYSKPILRTSTPDPICLGGEVDLKDLYTISNRISNQEYELEYTSAGGDISKTSIAKEHGEYKSRAWFKLSSGELCVSSFEKVFVTVQELEVAIDGKNTTCPGVGVELKADLTTKKNMGENDTPIYTWNVSPTGVTGQLETLNTSEEGLTKKGDKITVSLEVSMGACKGKKPVSTHTVTVDDPGVDGTIKFDEEYNANSGKGTYTLSKNGIVEFDGCNRKVDVLFNVKQTDDEFTYENLGTGVKKTGKFSNGEGNFDVKAGVYEVTYINTCATSFKFEVKDKSLDIAGSPSSWSVCEGQPLTIKIVNSDFTPFSYDPKKYKIEWQKDDAALPGYDSEVLYIASTTPNDNGVYSYTVTSSGCVYHDVIAMGGSFTSKPKVKVNESLLEKDGIYEVVRTKSKTITIPFTQPTDLSSLRNKIIWKEDGSEVNKGETLSLTNVVSDHDYHVVIANGEKGTDTEFCGTSLDITVKVDALLTISADIVGADGNGGKKDMCYEEEGVGIEIDTTGTGKVLHADKFTFKVIESKDGVQKEIKVAKKGDKLFAPISPDKSANYKIVYTYSVEDQDQSLEKEITVHPAYNVKWDENIRLCEGETGFIQITKLEPSDVTLTWDEDECIIGQGSNSGVNIEAVFSGYGTSTTKSLTLRANNGFCAEKVYRNVNFIIDKSIEGEIKAPEYVCEGHIATLDASSFKADEYVWTSDEFGPISKSGAIINTTPTSMYATYTVDMKRGTCTHTADANVTVRVAPRFDRIDSLSFRSIEIILESNTGTAPFQYIVDENADEDVFNSVKDDLEYGNHGITVIDDAGCQIDTTIVINAPGLEFPSHISPNGDGKDDVFSIPTLKDAYPEAHIRIFDRWGKQLASYKAGDEDMDWDGTYLGTSMPSTDYWYEVEIKEIKKTYTGHFTLIRQ